jgi:hypothetical protein
MTAGVARVAWLTEGEGGRRTLPTGPRYSTPARFEGQAPGPEGANWSLVLDLKTSPPQSTDWIADVRFLFPEAPHELLSKGARFELYEGKKCVARGVVLDVTPDQVSLSDVRPPVGRADVKQ